jgi:hypothetical protein
MRGNVAFVSISEVAQVTQIISQPLDQRKSADDGPFVMCAFYPFNAAKW